MTFDPGTRVGPFEITALLGAGGMGEVYKARDTRLGRDVAIKVLSPVLASDQTAMLRFEREARAVAALNHPNILALFDIGREGSSTYVVTELLEGGTLRERLVEGPLPLRKATDCARQVADALAAAHDRGVVHRDVKPENVFLSTDGRIKVLDFGLAQSTPVSGAHAATIAQTSVGTASGTIVGTVGYMSPEQVRGQSVDHRTDIFACGALLYELVTGRRAFEGATPADTLSAVLSSDPPPMTRERSAVSPRLERVVHRCLEKNPNERFQSARDLAFALSDDLSAGEEPAPRMTRVAWRIPATIAGAAVLSLLVYAFAPWSRTVPEATTAAASPVVRFAIAASTTWTDGVSISPDGQYIVYTGASAGAPSTAPIGAPLPRPAGFEAAIGRFWFRRIDALAASPLSDTASAYPYFFWSPDSRFLGYRAGDQVVVRELPGGQTRVVAELPVPHSMAWSPRGDILVANAEGIHRVAATGGKPQLLLRSQPDRELWRGMPSFLPGGQQFLFSILSSYRGEDALETRVATLDGQEVGTVGHGLVGASYADGHLLFGSAGALYAQPFDVATLALTGARRQLATSVTQDWRMGHLAARISDNGVLVYRGAPRNDVQFIQVDRTGRVLRQVGTPDSFLNFSVSPDDQRIATTRRDPLTGQSTLWLIDMLRGVTSLVSGRDTQVDVDDPTWAPDGQHLAYRRGGQMVMRLANGGPERTLLDAEAYPDSFSRDGRLLFFGQARGNHFEQRAIDLTNLAAGSRTLVTGMTLADESRMSPNGKWVAYHSNESGTAQVHVMPFPPTGEKWQVSDAGGVQPRWSHDGHELFFLDAEGRLLAVGMRESDPRGASKPALLFPTGLIASSALDQFAVLRHGFLLRVPVTFGEEAAAVQVLVNWKGAATR